MNKKYILILEDGTINTVDVVGTEDYTAAKDGIIDIIRVSDLSQYIDGDWEKIEKL